MFAALIPESCLDQSHSWRTYGFFPHYLFLLNYHCSQLILSFEIIIQYEYFLEKHHSKLSFPFPFFLFFSVLSSFLKLIVVFFFFEVSCSYVFLSYWNAFHSKEFRFWHLKEGKIVCNNQDVFGEKTFLFITKP